MADCEEKKCPAECSCRNKRPKSSSLRKRDPAFVSCASSPADARVVSVTSCTCGLKKYHSIEISCPFCGAYHKHGGGEVDKPIYYGSRLAHCHKGTYKIIPPL